MKYNISSQIPSAAIWTLLASLYHQVFNSTFINWLHTYNIWESEWGTEGEKRKEGLKRTTFCWSQKCLYLPWWGHQLVGSNYHESFASHLFHRRAAGTLISRGNFWYLGTLPARFGRRSCCTFSNYDVLLSWCATGMALRKTGNCNEC